MTPKLDYVPRHDDRNRLFRITAAPMDAMGLWDTSVFWTPSATILNQYSEGACVGGGVTNELGASPHRHKIYNDLLFDVYRRAKEIDEWEGVDYDGTSVRAGMMVGRERKWWTGFGWAFNMDELRTALEHSPVVIGVEWREGMYSAPEGVLSAKGEVVGGHCILLTGYTKRHRKIKGPAYRIRNSWGDDWGLNGSAYMDPAGLEEILFGAGGEAAFPTGKS